MLIYAAGMSMNWIQTYAFLSNIIKSGNRTHGPALTHWYIFIQANAFENVVWKMAAILFWPQCVNTLRPRQNGRHFPDDIFERIIWNENVWISINISLKFVPRGPINNIPTLLQVMAWRRPGDKPLSEPMMVRLTTHICVTRPQFTS